MKEPGLKQRQMNYKENHEYEIDEVFPEFGE